MKKFIFVALVLICAVNIVSAQKNTIANTNGTYITPKTSIIVEIVVKRESVTVGPYSRYATQLLGVVAPLNDKEIYSIEAVKIKDDTYGTMSGITKKGGKQQATFQKGNVLLGASSSQFKDMSMTPIFTESGGEKSMKAMATDAASVIFKLRQRRFDVVTGEAGEGVYGEGLKAALVEMARIEKEYLELFLGKNNVEYVTYQYEIVPEIGKENYMLCRFDKNSGIIDGLKITGTPVVLSVLDENRVATQPTVKRKSDAGMSHYAVADIALCKLSIGETILGEKRLPIFQLGMVGEDVINSITK